MWNFSHMVSWGGTMQINRAINVQPNQNLISLQVELSQRTHCADCKRHIHNFIVSQVQLLRVWSTYSAAFSSLTAQILWHIGTMNNITCNFTSMPTKSPISSFKVVISLLDKFICTSPVMWQTCGKKTILFEERFRISSWTKLEKVAGIMAMLFALSERNRSAVQ